MSDIDAILAGAVDADPNDVPDAFADWVAGVIEDRRLQRERAAADRPDPYNATTEIVEYDLNDLLEGGQP